MMCFNPIRLKREKPSYKGDFIDVPCGKCDACLSNKRQEWLSRLLMEYECHDFATFITLTYDEEHIPRDQNGNPCFDKDHIQRYIKRLRKTVQFRYFLVCEYGEKGQRPHYHAILFGLPYSAENDRLLTEQWPYGFVKASPANPRRIGYCCKYILFKSDTPPDHMRPFMLCSRKPALGTDFFQIDALSSLIEEQRKMILNLKCKINMCQYLDFSETSFYRKVQGYLVSPDLMRIYKIIPTESIPEWLLTCPAPVIRLIRKIQLQRKEMHSLIKLINHESAISYEIQTQRPFVVSLAEDYEESI